MDHYSHEFGNVVVDNVVGCNYLRRKVRKPQEHRDVMISNKMQKFTEFGDCYFADANINGAVVRVFKQVNDSNWKIFNREKIEAMQPAPKPTHHRQQSHHMHDRFDRTIDHRQNNEFLVKKTKEVAVILKKTKRIVRPDTCFE